MHRAPSIWCIDPASIWCTHLKAFCGIGIHSFEDFSSFFKTSSLFSCLLSQHPNISFFISRTFLLSIFGEMFLSFDRFEKHHQTLNVPLTSIATFSTIQGWKFLEYVPDTNFQELVQNRYTQRMGVHMMHRPPPLQGRHALRNKARRTRRFVVRLSNVFTSRSFQPNKETSFRRLRISYLRNASKHTDAIVWIQRGPSRLPAAM